LKEVIILNKKFLGIGIIFLFIGVAVQPTFANNITLGNVKQQLGNKYSITTNPVFPRSGTFNKTFGRNRHG
jgi:hypothetical protein